MESEELIPEPILGNREIQTQKKKFLIVVYA